MPLAAEIPSRFFINALNVWFGSILRKRPLSTPMCIKVQTCLSYDCSSVLRMCCRSRV